LNGTINPQSVMIANDDPATRAEEQAVSNFSKGMNCAQSVFLVFASQYGIEPAIALRLSAAMGGGIGRKQEICGAFNAGNLVIGLHFGNSLANDKEAKEKTSALAQLFLDRMEKTFGGTTCSQILGGSSLKTADDRKLVKMKNLSELKCVPCIRITARVLAELTLPKTKES
jgi:C_GCAxxG_C_C family probable redox protein